MFSGISNIFNYLGIALGLVPAIVQLVKSFEVPGFGAEKKALIIAVVKVVWPKLQEFVKELQPIKWEAMENIVSQVIDMVVGFFNAVGLFKHELKGEEELKLTEGMA
jgi:hypothetical protein